MSRVENNSFINPYAAKMTSQFLSFRYRKIAGDVCEDGDEEEFQPYNAKCCEIAESPTKSPEGEILVGS